MATGSRRCPRASRSSATSPGAPFAAIADEERRFYGVQFHPEVVHTPDGAQLLAELRPPHRRPVRRLDHGGLPRAGGRGDPRQGRRRQGDLRAVRRRRFLRRGGADPRGDRRPADLHLRRSRPAAHERGGRGRHHVPRPLQHPAGPRAGAGHLHRRAGGRDGPGGQAQDHRPAVHRDLRGRGQEDRRRRLPCPGHALSGRDRERLLHRRPVGDHQVAPQCRRPAGTHEHAARRALARTVQGRGAPARTRTRPARQLSSAAIPSRDRASPFAARAA